MHCSERTRRLLHASAQQSRSHIRLLVTSAGNDRRRRCEPPARPAYLQQLTGACAHVLCRAPPVLASLLLCLPTSLLRARGCSWSGPLTEATPVLARFAAGLSHRSPARPRLISLLRRTLDLSTNSPTARQSSTGQHWSCSVQCVLAAAADLVPTDFAVSHRAQPTLLHRHASIPQ